MLDEARIAEYLAGSLSAEQRAAFERDIAGNPEALRELIAQKKIDAGLRALLDPQTQRVESAIMATVRSASEESAVDRVLAETVRPRIRKQRSQVFEIFNPRGWRFNARFAPIAATCALAVCALIAWLVFRGNSSDEDLVAESNEPPGIARLIRGADVVWARDNDAIGIGASLSEGTLQLESGVVEIEFTSGAQMVLEGPAELELISPMKSRLNFGKFSAQVPRQARGFSVDVEGVEVTDLGTAFGVSKPSSGPLEVHVFTGKVEVTSPNAGKARELTEGKALRFETNTESALPADRKAFVSPEELQRREAEELQAHYERWKKASAELEKDAALVAHFRFEDRTSPAQLLNQARSARPETHGKISSCAWIDGRWPGKGALQFTNRSDRVRWKAPGTFQSLTYAAWVSIDNLSRPNNALAMSQRFKSGDVRWEITSPGALRLTVFSSRSNWVTVTGPRQLKSQFGRWIHLAAVYDGPGKSMALYLNGKRIASRTIDKAAALVLDDVELGNWSPLLNPPSALAERKERQRPSFAYRNFHGRMDEFAFWSRPLSAEEIRKLYESGKPRNETVVSAHAPQK